MDPAQVAYDHSGQIPEAPAILQQPRALQALESALRIPKPGYNVFISGYPGLGRTYLVREFLTPRAADAPTPDDVVYLHNFDDPDRPKAIRLPAGQGKKLKNELATAVSALTKEIAARMEEETLARKRDALRKNFHEAKDELIQKIEEDANGRGFNVNLDEHGSISVYPLVEGKVVGEQDFERLDKTTRNTLRHKSDELVAGMTVTLRQIGRRERELRENERKLEREAVEGALKEILDPVAEHYAGAPALAEHFAAMREDILGNFESLLPQDPDRHKDQSSESPDDGLTNYEVNLFVSREENTGAPVVICDHPTPANLLGCIEREAELGALYTDFTLVKAGDLHRANGGFLILRMEDLKQNPDAWDGLLRSLLAGSSRIEDLGDSDQSRTKTIEPEPLPLNLKVMLVGTDEDYELLLAHEDRFPKLFKLKAQLQDTMERTPETIEMYLGQIGRIARCDDLPQFDREALAGLVDFASRDVEDQKRLSLRFPVLREVMIEAAALAENTVGRKHLDEALVDRRFRANLYEEEFHSDYDRELIKVKTKGSAVGRANGLSVTWIGDHEFGLPHQIACAVGVGHGGIMDLEREAELGGPIHTKGMMIIKSYLLEFFAQDKPLTLTGSLCFEQSYAEVEGDSASGAELAALLSALSGAAINLSLAITGAVSQSGAIMAVGGVNPKIEGFFRVCKRRGLTGSQGVIIPQDNVQHLMLADEVVEAVKAGTFHVYPVDSIEQVLEILTGKPAGAQRVNGKFPKGSIYRDVDDRLAQLAKLAECDGRGREGRETRRRR
jgi:predicted ATP-dependent protease